MLCCFKRLAILLQIIYRRFRRLLKFVAARGWILKKDALIKLQGRAEGSEVDIIDFTSMGTVSFEGSAICIEYDESEMSGMEDSVSRIFIDGGSVTLNRVGTYVSTMAFIEGEELPAAISTPHGEMNIRIFTDNISLSVTDNKIDLNLNYAFSLGGERIRNHLWLNCRF